MQERKTTEPEQPVLICRKRDAGIVLGLQILHELSLHARAPPTELADLLQQRFPKSSFQRDIEEPIRILKSMPGMFRPHLEILMVYYDPDQQALNELYFQHRGYIVDFKTHRLDVLRGDQLEEPSRILFEQLTRTKKNYALKALSRRDKMYFPYRIEN